MEEKIRAFPSALGLCVPLSCDRGCDFGDYIPDIHEGGRKIGTVFDMLGYSVCPFRNPSKKALEAIYRVIANIQYPPSYKRLFLFFTGHGLTDRVSTHDGLINISTLIKESSTAAIPMIFIFDCCRNELLGYNHTELLKAELQKTESSDRTCRGNVLVLYTTLYGQRSYEGRDGAGIPTTKLVEILNSSQRNLLEIQKELHDAIKEDPSVPTGMDPELHSTIYKDIFLHKERLEASELSASG